MGNACLYPNQIVFDGLKCKCGIDFDNILHYVIMFTLWHALAFIKDEKSSTKFQLLSTKYTNY